MDIKEIAIKLEEIYRGLQRAHGTFKITEKDPLKGKMTGKALTVADIPSVEKWQAHLEGKVGIGIVPIDEENKCRWGAIDVDSYNTGVVEEFEEKCRKLAMPVAVIRTKSGGAHITAYVKEPIAASIMRSKMVEMAAALGVANVEIYPKQIKLASERDTGNWLNMPYFNATDTTRYAIYKGKGLDLEQFLELIDIIRLPPEEFIELSFTEGDHFSDGPPCLQMLAKQGIGAGARNEGLFAMGLYAKFADESRWQEKVEEYNHLFVQPPLQSREIQALIKSIERKEYFYTCTKPPIVSFCNKELCKKRKYGIGFGATDTLVEIGQLVKIECDPPVWIIDVDGLRIEMETDDLMNQGKFHKLCVNKVNKWPPVMKPQQWRDLVQSRMDHMEIQQAPEEASPEGRFMWHLEQFCIISAPARAREEVLLGKPWTEEGRHYFRSEDLMRYLNVHHFRDISPRKAWSILRNKAGAKHTQFTLKGRCVQCWSIPEFTRQQDDFDRIGVEVEF